MSEIEKIEKQLEKITLDEKLAPRPGLGNLGQKVLLQANYYKISKFPNLKLHLYNFNVTSSANRTTGKRIRWKVFEEVRKKKKFGNYLPIFNGNDMIYCSAKLPLENDKSQITLPPTEDGDKASNFNVTINYNKEFNLQSLNDYITSKQGWDGDVQTCMHALNAYLSCKVRTNFLCVGRGVYSPQDPIMLSGGVELRRGFCQSLRVGWDSLIINVDVCSGMFCPPGNVIDVASGILKRGSDNLRRGINDKDRSVLVKALKGLRFRVLHREKTKKSIYMVQTLTRESADRIKFRDGENRETTVSKFFAEKYKIKLEFGSLPCILVNKNSFPMEVCEILPDQSFKGDITDEARADMIKHTCVKPFERFKDIEGSEKNIFRYNQDENLKSINMEVNTGSMMKVEGRVLANVRMTFKGTTQEIKGGRWNFVNQKIQDGKTLTSWSILVLSGDHPNAALQFAKQLAETLNSKGMNFTNDPPPVVTFNHQGNMKQALIQAAKKHKDPPQLILVIMRERSYLYKDIKRIAETELGLRTQCCLSRHIRRPKEQYCVNLGLKINAKLGGKNSSLLNTEMPFISNAPTMVFGADVFHSGPNEQHVPSIAAVTASMDAAATIYSGRYSMNKERRNETIEQLDHMVIELLKAFRSKNNRLPERIIFYRDGVSEGQFRKVMNVEVKKLREAFKGGYGDKPPKLTFVIVQKRHHTRFMPANQRDSDRGNCKPGTIVDTGIVVKQEFDFFLQSHASLLGTGRPTHYRVLIDENKFTANDFQSLTNKLCYLNARCTSAVSMVTSAYYAHLMCNRARHYLIWEGESSSEGTATCAKVNNHLTNLMYFI